jgi:hypothetical protein
VNATIITAIALALLGGAILIFFLYSLYIAVAQDASGLTEKLLLRRKKRWLSEIDILIKSGSNSDACRALRKALVLEHLRSGSESIEASVQLHMNILARVIMIAERTGATLDNLPVVEDLIHSRGQLLHSYLEALDDKRLFRSRRAKAGKEAPAWAISEFSRKIEEIEDRIKTNSRSLSAQFEELLQALARGDSSSQITFH